MQPLVTHRFSQLPKDHIRRSIAFLITGILLSSLGFSAIGPGPLIASSLCVLWSVIGVITHIRGALAVLLFAAVHLPAGFHVGVACFLIGLGIAVIDFLFTPDSSLPEKLRPLRNELRDAEFQQEILHRHIARYPILLDSCTLFSSAQELGQLAKMLCDQSMKIAPQFHHIGVFYGKGDDIYCAHAINHKKDSIELDITNNEMYVIGEARPLVLRHEAINHIYIPLRGDRRQETMHMKHGLNGALYISYTNRGIDDEFIIDIFRALGRLAGLTLAAVNLMEQARELALHDDLTGLYGRHEFQRRLNENISYARRHNKILGLIMCDMDHLKKFNDTYGHQAGDTALKSIAKAIETHIPDDAVACRFGGEEFSCFVVVNEINQVKDVAQRVHASIRDTELDVDTNLTASIGWTYLKEADEIKDLIHRADEACYAAKEQGRDRIIEGEHE